MAAPTPQAVTPPSTTNARKVKLSQVINQADDEEVEALDQNAINKAYKAYKDKIGGFPPDDEELSAEQLTSLHALFQSGMIPYTDMAVWGPFQPRIQKKIKIKGVRFNSAGEILPVELYGPPDFESWRECYMVFRTGAVMFEQISPAKLDGYEKRIRHFSERYGKTCWPIIYQADVRARLEHAERLRRMGQEAYERAQPAGLNHQFNPHKPWEWVWGELTMEVLGFGQREVTVTDPYMLYLAKSTNLQALVRRMMHLSVDSVRSSLRPPDQCIHNPLKLHNQANVHGARTSESTRLEKTATIPTTEGELSCAECSNLVSAQRKTHGATAPRMATEDINAPNAYQSYMAPSNVSQKDRNSREPTTVRKAVERARSDTRKRNQCMRIQECE